MILIDTFKKNRIVLATKSVRRHELFRELGIDFEILSNSEVKEDYPSNLQEEQIPLYLAKLKSKHYSSCIDEKTILITADTIVWLNGHVIGKPKDEEDAVRILKNLSGRKHQVYTGVCIKSCKKENAFYVKTDVFFRNLSEEEIRYYVKKYKPYDKAGAYGIQEWIGYIGVERIEGSFYNVMGLPVQRLYYELIKFLE